MNQVPDRKRRGRTALMKQGQVVGITCAHLALALLLTLPTSAPAQRAPTALGHRTQQSLDRDLIEACEHEDASAVAALLRQGANANARGKFRQTALMVARHNIELARILLAHGAAINARDKDGDTVLNLTMPFGMRVSEGDQPNEYLAFLLQHGANVNLSDYQGYTPLMHAVAEQAVASTRLLLSQGANIQSRDHSGRTALIIAADFGDWDVGDGHEEERQLATLRQLLEQGANINAADYTGRTALMAAAYQGHAAILAFLLEHDAAVQAKDRYGRTVLTWALSGGAGASILDRLRPYHLPVGVTEALLMNDLSQARDLLTHDAAPGVVTPQGDTSLILAAEKGDPDLVERLLKRGAPVNRRGYSGTTALMRVIGGHFVVGSSGYSDWKNAPALPNQIRIARLLLAHGADPNLRTEPHMWGDTALKVAKEVKNEAMIAILIKAGAEQEVSSGSVNDRQVQTNIEAAQKTLTQMIDLLNHIQHRQRLPTSEGAFQAPCVPAPVADPIDSVQQRQYALNRLLIAAIDRNDARAIRRLLRQGADPNTLVVLADKRSWPTRRFDPRHDDPQSIVSVLMRAVESSMISAAWTEFHPREQV